MKTIKVKKNPKMKVIDLREDKLEKIRSMVTNLCHKSFYDGGCVNDADLDDIEEEIRKLCKMR